MSAEIKVRKSLRMDAEAILSLRRALYVSADLSDAAFDDVFFALLAEPKHCILVLEAEGEVVAYASGYKHVTLYAGGFVAYLDEIVVASEARGKQLGTALLQAFEQWAIAEDCALIGLATGGARGFYEKLGYQSKAGYYKKMLG